MDDDAGLRQAWTVIRLVAAAVVVTDVIYMVVCVAIAQTGPAGGEFRGFLDMQGNETFDLLRTVFMAVSVPIAGVSLWVKAFIKRREAGGEPRLPAFATPEGRRAARLLGATLVSMSIAEVPGILGLVSFLLMGGLARLAVFLSISFATKLALFPRKSELDEMADEERMDRM